MHISTVDTCKTNNSQQRKKVSGINISEPGMPSHCQQYDKHDVLRPQGWWPKDTHAQICYQNTPNSLHSYSLSINLFGLYAYSFKICMQDIYSELSVFIYLSNGKTENKERSCDFFWCIRLVFPSYSEYKQDFCPRFNAT